MRRKWCTWSRDQRWAIGAECSVVAQVLARARVSRSCSRSEISPGAKPAKATALQRALTRTCDLLERPATARIYLISRAAGSNLQPSALGDGRSANELRPLACGCGSTIGYRGRRLTLFRGAQAFAAARDRILQRESIDVALVFRMVVTLLQSAHASVIRPDLLSWPCC